MAARRRAEELRALGRVCGSALESAHRSREEGLAACRNVIRLSSRSIRAIHRGETKESARLAQQAERALRKAQGSLEPFPAIAHAGFLHDAEKEYAEARLTAALVQGNDLEGPPELAVGVPAWLNGLAEAASELRRHLLDCMRSGELERAEQMLQAMEDVYDTLVAVDYPDAITGGLRRTTDSLRAVLERSRADVTSATLQLRLQQALEARAQREAR